MKFVLEIDCDNAAFEDDANAEVARILRKAADKLERGPLDGLVLRDINGNAVGHTGYILTVGKDCPTLDAYAAKHDTANNG